MERVRELGTLEGDFLCKRGYGQYYVTLRAFYDWTIGWPPGHRRLLFTCTTYLLQPCRKWLPVHLHVKNNKNQYYSPKNLENFARGRACERKKFILPSVYIDEELIE